MHHDQSPSVQQRFVAPTKPLIIAFQEAGNPFDEDSHEVVIIDTREVMPDNVASIIMGGNGEGEKQRADFVAHRLQSTAVLSYSTHQSRLTKSTSPAIDINPATKVSMWIAPRKTCTY